MDGQAELLGNKKTEAKDWVWIDRQESFDEVVSELRQSAEIALDTEFHRERTYFAKLALIQIAWKDHVALIDPFGLDLTVMRSVFEMPVTVILHAGVQDLEILSRAVGLLPPSIFDTQIAAGFIGFSNPSLMLLGERLLGLTLPKGDRLTDWTKRPLSEGQLRYAASDVSHLAELKKTIESRLKQMGRLEWAWDESHVLLERDRSSVPIERAWWKIKECRHLKGQSRKVAQALAAWREERASTLDIPVRYVLSDLAVAVISQEMPKSIESLSGLRGVEPRFLVQGVDKQILQVVARGGSMAESDLHIPDVHESDKRTRPIASLVITWATQLAQSMHIDPLLLATRADITGFLQGDADSRLSSGWRNEVLGEPIKRLAAGELAIAFNSKSGELELEERSNRTYRRR